MEDLIVGLLELSHLRLMLRVQVVQLDRQFILLSLILILGLCQEVCQTLYLLLVLLGQGVSLFIDHGLVSLSQSFFMFLVLLE